MVSAICAVEGNVYMYNIYLVRYRIHVQVELQTYMNSPYVAKQIEKIKPFKINFDSKILHA